MRLWTRLVLGASYTLLAVAGVLVVVYREAPRTIAAETNKPTEYVWAIFCLVGGFLGLCGVVRNRLDLELLGLPLCATASMAWAVAILLESRGAPNTIAAAAMAAAFAGFLTSRFAEKYAVVRFDVRGDRK